MSGPDFLSRWSRRKRAAAAETPPVREVATPPETPRAEPEAPQAEGEAPQAEPGTALIAPAPDEPGLRVAEEIARLPALETLTSETDLAPFLRAGIPKLLRNAALRRMWSLDPAIRDYVSEAREYAYDWNVVGGVPGQGPMLPTDDIAAMLRDIFEGTPQVIPEAAEPEVPDVCQVVAAPAIEPVAETLPGFEANAEREVEGVQEPLPAPQPRAATIPPVRRHGGAVPI